MKPFLIITAGAIICILLVKFAFRDPSLEKTNEATAIARFSQRPLLARQAYSQELKQDTLNYKSHYQVLENLHDIFLDKAHKMDYEDVNINNIRSYYESYTASANPKLRDIGYFALGTISFFQLDGDTVFGLFSKISDKSLARVNLMLGMQSQRDGNTPKALYYYQKEVSIQGDAETAYRKMAFIYYEKKDWDAYGKIAAVPHSESYLPFDETREYYFGHSKFGPYFILVLYKMFAHLNWLAVLCAIGIMLVWMAYIRKLDILKPENWLLLLLIVALGGFFSNFTFPVDDTYRFLTHTPFIEENTGDFFFWFVNVGMVEELVKIIPLLLLVWFTPIIKKPIDYIIFACASALGFALVENSLYFHSLVLDTIVLRGVLSTTMHMFMSSLVAYGLILARYRKNTNSFLAFAIYFIVAAAIHAAFDFSLENGAGLLTFLFIAIPGIFMWGTFINNAMNQSDPEGKTVELAPKHTGAYLYYSFAAVCALAFLLEGFVYGPTVTMEKTSPVVLLAIPMLTIIALRLTNFEIIPMYWQPFSIKGITLLKNGYDNIGRHMSITSMQDSGFLGDTTLTGVFIKNMNVEDLEWHLVKLDQEFKIGSDSYRTILLGAKDDGYPTGLGKDIICAFMLFDNDLNLDLEEYSKGDFQFVDWVVVNPIWNLQLAAATS